MRLIISVLFAVGFLAGSANAEEEVDTIVMGKVEVVKKFGVCFDRDSADAVVAAAKKHGSGYTVFIKFMRTGQCGLASGTVVFDRILESYKDYGSVSADGTMHEVELRVLRKEGEHITVWGFVGATLVEPSNCNDCL